jgi:pimeloyl-ACP methyl ester carboxylesterase
MENPTAFTIEVPQAILDDLKIRLAQTRWTDEPANAGWSYGTNPAYLRQLCTYWKDKYDWRRQESILNGFAQFKTTIDGIGIHFLQVKGTGKDPKPLLLTHGWPDSFYRFYKAIPMLSNPAGYGLDPDLSFDVIVPSVPGFAFSDRVAQNSDRTAALWAKLMTGVLGYKTFFAAGGDIGAMITKSLANQFPTAVKAIHLTDVGYPTGRENWATMSAPEQEFGQFIQRWWYTEGAYNMLQSSKPQTLGYGLNDSPIGLASWIVEKFYGWSGNPKNLESHFSKDELITNIMIYWITQTINTSIRTYAEEARAGWTTGLRSAERVDIPTGVALFPGDAPFPMEWIRRKVNAQHVSKFEKGGHFAALDSTETWVKDLRDFFGSY